MGMRTVQYHPVHARLGREFDMDFLPPAENGWVDTPAKFPKDVPKRIAKQTLEESLAHGAGEPAPPPVRSAEPELASPDAFPDVHAYMADFQDRLDLSMTRDQVEAQLKRARDSYGAWKAQQNMDRERDARGGKKKPRGVEAQRRALDGEE